MAAFLKVLISVPDTNQSMKDKIIPNGSADLGRDITKAAQYFERISQGAVLNASVTLAVAPVQATGTITFSSIANNDTITIGGVVFTAKTSGASGAVQFNIGGSDTNAAANAAVVINAHTTVGKLVTATSAAAVITLTAVYPGIEGNQIPIAISAHGSVSAATLASGTDGTTSTYLK
jgi:phage tail sheath gpL-like